MKLVSHLIALLISAAVITIALICSSALADAETPPAETCAIELTEASHGVTVEIVDEPEQQPMPMVKLLELTEEELFSRWPTVIVRGTVSDIKNIKLDAVADEISLMRAIVTVTPSSVLRGEVEGDLKILVSCPIDGSFILEDTETVSAIRLGMEGIFMVLPYEDDELWELENSALRWKDLADYHFPDGRRYAFLSTEDGLLYPEWAYPSLKGAQTLDDVEAFVISMIGDVTPVTE